MANTLLELTGVVSILAIMFFICVFTDALSLLGLGAPSRHSCKYGVHCKKPRQKPERDRNLEQGCNLDPEQMVCRFIHKGDVGLTVPEQIRIALGGRGQRPICKGCCRFLDSCDCTKEIVRNIQDKGEKGRDQWAENALARRASALLDQWKGECTQRGAENRAAALKRRRPAAPSAGKQGKGH